MSTSDVSLLNVSIGCNRVADCIDWGSGGELAYGANVFVAIFSLSESRTVATLAGHTGRVNTVRWVSDNEIVSGASDGCVILWRRAGPGASFTEAQRFQLGKSVVVVGLCAYSYSSTTGNNSNVR